MELFQELNLNGALCFDIGANIGNKTENFLNLGASVVCVEPQQYCFSVLESKFSENKKVKIIQTALGASNEVKKIFISQENTLTTMSEDFIAETKKDRFKNTVWGEGDFINVTTLDEIIKNYGTPMFCKIDVEGYEVEVIKGLSKPIKYISLEFIPELKQKTFDCIKLMNNLGNYNYNYIEGESTVFTFNNWISSDEMINFLSKNNDFKNSFGDLYAKLS